MARVKNIEGFCNFCNSITKMELAGEVSGNTDENKRWAKCKKCKQTTLIDLRDKNGVIKPTLNDFTGDNCSDYSPLKSFEIGESIFHKSWDDFGIVVAKEILSSGRSSITVEFQKLGQKKLIETLTK